MDGLQRYYITPFMDENMLMNVVSGGAPVTDYFYAQDGLGTIRQIFNASSSLVNNYDYEGFGTNSGKSETIYNRFRYTGREFDEETESTFTLSTSTLKNDGLYYYRARTYDTSVGSFTSRDPIPALNFYPYCAANPINFTDPFGEKPTGRTGNIRVSYSGCKDCAEEYLQCVINKAYDAIYSAYIALSRLYEDCDAGNTDATTLQFHTTVIDQLNASYSFFDKTAKTGFKGFSGFDATDSDHVDALEDIVDNLENMLDNMSDQTITCKSSAKMGNLMGQADASGNNISINMGLLCKKKIFTRCNFLNKNKADSYEFHTAWTFIHELSHTEAGTTDSGHKINNKKQEIYIRATSKKNPYKSLDLDKRKRHADTYTRFIMNYYQAGDKCVVDEDCCTTMRESTK